MMHEHLDHMKYHSTLLKVACGDLEKAAERMEEVLDGHTPESPLERAACEWIEEVTDLLCALAQSQAADSCALHAHLSASHKPT